MWDVGTGKCLRTFEGHTESLILHVLAGWPICPLSGGYDHTLRLWDVSSVIDLDAASPWFYSMVVSAGEALERERSHRACVSRAREALEAGRIDDALAFLRRRAPSGDSKRVLKASSCRRASADTFACDLTVVDG